MSTLNLQPPRVALVDPKTGMITREWYRYITDSFVRQGGHDSASNSDLDVAMPEDSGVAELEMLLHTVNREHSQDPLQFALIDVDEINQAPPVQMQAIYETLESMQIELRQSAELIATLMKQVEDLKQGTLS